LLLSSIGCGSSVNGGLSSGGCCSCVGSGLSLFLLLVHLLLLAEATSFESSTSFVRNGGKV
jgi:hypothetical protein